MKIGYQVAPPFSSSSSNICFRIASFSRCFFDFSWFLKLCAEKQKPYYKRFLCLCLPSPSALRLARFEHLVAGRTKQVSRVKTVSSSLMTRHILANTKSRLSGHAAIIKQLLKYQCVHTEFMREEEAWFWSARSQPQLLLGEPHLPQSFSSSY